MSRIELQDVLESLLGSRNVYFQPPESIKLQYPAIVYCLNDIKPTHANNGKYLWNHNYTLTLIDKDPDSEFVEMILQLPLCRFDRHYKSDNLNHFVFSLYI